jgi:hypothetical protein
LERARDVRSAKDGWLGWNAGLWWFCARMEWSTDHKNVKLIRCTLKNVDGDICAGYGRDAKGFSMSKHLSLSHLCFSSPLFLLPCPEHSFNGCWY